jgi:hypothetical protein
MLKKLLVFSVLALGVASAESYRVNLSRPSVVKGNELKAGDYKLDVEQGKATFKDGNRSVESAVRVENADKKYDRTTVRYDGRTIAEIRLGGTNTKLVFAE